MERKIVRIVVFLLVLMPFIVFAEVSERGDNLEIKTYAVQHGEAAALVEVMDQIKSPQGDVTVYETGNMLIVVDTPKAHARIANLLAKLDIAAEQVLIDVLFVETTGSLLRNAGIIGNGEIISAREFGKVWYLLENDTSTTIQSQMTLRTISGNSAKLQAADHEFSPGEVYHDEGYAVVVPPRERKAGSFLDILPRVNGDGTIRVDIVPTQSEFTGENTMRERSIITSVIINDGDTIVLGGMDSSHQSTLRSNEPLSGFGFGRAEQTDNNTVIFLTVKIDPK